MKRPQKDDDDEEVKVHKEGGQVVSAIRAVPNIVKSVGAANNYYNELVFSLNSKL